MSNKIAVILWLYHNDLSDEFYSLLDPIKNLIDLHLCLCKDNNNSQTVSLMSNLSCTKSISYYPNCGADIYSFLQILPLIDNKYFIKIHSKKSLWGLKKHCNWRAILLDSLIGSRSILQTNISKLEKYNANYLSAYSLTYKNNNYIHENQINELLDILDLDINMSQQKFCGGNMFIGNTKFYQDTLAGSLDKICELLSQETGKINEYRDGTYSHAMERIFGYCVPQQTFIKSCLDTIKIKVTDNDLLKKNIKYIRLKPMYNNDIYCVDQPNIYGTIKKWQKKDLHIVWYHADTQILARYIKIKGKIYQNILYNQ